MNHLLITPFLLLSLCSLFISPAAMSSTAAVGETVSYEVDGLSADAQIIVDEYGVPHI